MGQAEYRGVVIWQHVSTFDTQEDFYFVLYTPELCREPFEAVCYMGGMFFPSEEKMSFGTLCVKESEEVYAASFMISGINGF